MQRLILLLITATLSFGCMGAVNGLTGLDIDMQFGVDSVHPADFVVKEPAGAEKLMSMGMTADAESMSMPENVRVDLSAYEKVRMDLISYAVKDAEASALLAVEELHAAGFEDMPSEDPAVRLLAGPEGMYVVTATQEGDQPTMTLIRLVPKDVKPETVEPEAVEPEAVETEAVETEAVETTP